MNEDDEETKSTSGNGIGSLTQIEAIGPQDK